MASPVLHWFLQLCFARVAGGAGGVGGGFMGDAGLVLLTPCVSLKKHEASTPPRGRRRDVSSTCSLVQHLGLWLSAPPPPKPPVPHLCSPTPSPLPLPLPPPARTPRLPHPSTPSPIPLRTPGPPPCYLLSHPPASLALPSIRSSTPSPQPSRPPIPADSGRVPMADLQFLMMTAPARMEGAACLRCCGWWVSCAAASGPACDAK